MPCNHRFQNDLNHDYAIKCLFIGTFNPSWQRQNNDNAAWFYGRDRNKFWTILPTVLNNIDLSPYKNQPQILKDWCIKNSIGITDLISSITDAEEANPQHFDWITGVKDKDLERFQDIQWTNIQDLILKNKSTLQGVYLTRYEHTLPTPYLRNYINPEFPSRGALLNNWHEIKGICQNLNIYTNDLVTPSGGYRGLNTQQKIEYWQANTNF